MRWSEEYQAELVLWVADYIQKHPRWNRMAFWQFSNTRACLAETAYMRPRGFNNKGAVTEYRAPKKVWLELVKR